MAAIRGDRIRERRKQLGLSQEELAAQVGIDQKQISNYESSKGNPTADSLIELVRVLGVSTDWILGLTDDPTPPFRLHEQSYTWKEKKAIAAWRHGDKLEAIKMIANDE